jgi:hypothetical protein
MKCSAIDRLNLFGYDARTSETTGVEIGVSENCGEKSLQTKKFSDFFTSLSVFYGGLSGGSQDPSVSMVSDTPICSSRRPHWRECCGYLINNLGVAHHV